MIERTDGLRFRRGVHTIGSAPGCVIEPQPVTSSMHNGPKGLAPEEARRQAMLTFGNVALAKEDTRAVWVWVWAEQFFRMCATHSGPFVVIQVLPRSSS